MTVFPFPPDPADPRAPFSVVGFDWETGAPGGELLVLPSGGDLPSFEGPIFAPEAVCADARLLRPTDGAPPGGAVWMDAFSPRGTLRARLTSAVAAFGPRLWVHIEPLSQLFTLPCPDGVGTPISSAERRALLSAHPGHFCPELVCRCAHWPDGDRIRVLLYDTDDTLAMKLALASACGVCRAFGRLTLPPR